jgi:acetyl esterase/lipase
MFLSAIGLLDWVVDYKIALVVAAVRVGPEDPHPAQVEDGYAALVWTHANARVRRFDPKRIGLLGFSGGGGVAAATALYSRDHGGPHVSNLVLVSPMMDDREVFQSSLFEDVMWPRESNRTGWWAILGDKVGGPDVSPYAAPSRAMNLDRMPPTYLETGTADTFRDETIDFATRLIHTGVPVDLHVWAGVMHGSGGLKPDAIVARAGTAARLSYIQRFATHPGRDCSGLPSNAARLT